ncbi:MAG: maleate cis-trans isomerase family protein [Nitrospira sp.]
MVRYVDMSLPELIELPVTVDSGYGSRARIGLIVLASDRTIEVEVAMLSVPDVAVYHTRIPMVQEVTPSTLASMEAHLPAVAALLPPGFDLGAIGYACTSAATIIGPDRVTKALQAAHPQTPCSNPLSAAIAALATVGATRVALIAPYTADVTRPLAQRLLDAGFEIAAMGSFLEPDDLVVARISAQAIVSGVREVVQETAGAADAVFMSCTAMRTMGIIDVLENDLNIPVISSNQAMIWHLLRLAGVDDAITGFGSLLRDHPAIVDVNRG